MRPLLLTATLALTAFLAGCAADPMGTKSVTVPTPRTPVAAFDAPIMPVEQAFEDSKARAGRIGRALPW